VRVLDTAVTALWKPVVGVLGLQLFKKDGEGEGIRIDLRTSAGSWSDDTNLRGTNASQNCKMPVRRVNAGASKLPRINTRHCSKSAVRVRTSAVPSHFLRKLLKMVRRGGLGQDSSEPGVLQRDTRPSDCSPAALDLFTWLSYRCFVAKGKERVPLFGEIGLVSQLGSADYSRPRKFRERLEGWLDLVRAMWPECPAPV